MVQNVGLTDLNDIELYLYYNMNVVNYTFISDLPRGEVKNISFYWIPTEYNRYNFTAYSPSIINEVYNQNNINVKVIYLENRHLNGLYLTYKYIWEGTTDIRITNITYSLLNSNIYRVNMTTYGERPSWTCWNEWANTRLVINNNPMTPLYGKYHTFVR